MRSMWQKENDFQRQEVGERGRSREPRSCCYSVLGKQRLQLSLTSNILFISHLWDDSRVLSVCACFILQLEGSCHADLCTEAMPNVREAVVMLEYPR